MKKRWNLLPVNQQRVTRLQTQIDLPKPICEILIQRGIDTPEAFFKFNNPSKQQLHDPYLMKDMQLAVIRINKALSEGEKILVFGDYDVDGTTAVACMYRFLKSNSSIANQIGFYIPDRYKEGYGISKQGIDYANDNGYTLIISLDCGIKSTDLIAYAKTLYIDFIICDHHLPGPELPDAVAILNPKQPECNYPFKELCGCGVGYKLICAILIDRGLSIDHADIYLDLVATAIAADIVPLTDENRVLATLGLAHINKNPSAAIVALLETADAKLPLQITNLVFLLAPRINAAGRMDTGRKAVELFIEKDTSKIKQLAANIQNDNKRRKEEDSSITKAALQMIEDSSDMQNRKSTVVFNPSWHKGVVGIVASRLIESYYKPTIVLTQNNGYITGSARGIAGFNLYDAIYQCREHLTAFGGHFAAAGLTLLPDNLPAFTKKFESVASATLSEEMLQPQINIDTEIDFNEINMEFYKHIQSFEPFGPENLRPVFITRNVINQGSRIVKEEHAQMIVTQNEHIIRGIGFNMRKTFEQLNLQQPFDIVYTLHLNEWNNTQSIQLRVLDMRNN